MTTRELPAGPAPAQAAQESYWTKDFVFTCLAGFCDGLATNIVNPILPLLVTHLGGNAGQVGLVMAFRTFTALVARPISGMIADRGFVIRMFAFSGLDTMLSGLGYMFSNAIWHLSGVQIFKGLGLTANTTSSGTVVAELAPASRRGEAIGIYGIVVPVASVFGPALGMFLLGRAGFPSVFGLCSVLGFATLLLVSQVRLPKKERPAHVPIRLVNKEALLPAALVTFVVVPQVPIYAYMPLFFKTSNLGDPSLYFTACASSMIVIRTVTGRLSDTLGRTAVLVPGVLLMSLSSLYVSTNPGYWGTLASGALLGAGFGAAFPSIMALAIDRARLMERGSATATVYMFVDVGYTLATLADGFILDRASFGVMFALNAMLPIIGLSGFLLIRRLSHRPQLAGS